MVARGVVGGLVLAAGAGRRFGSPKQLALLEGRPLLEHALIAMATARRVDTAVVVLGAHADAVLGGVDLRGLVPVICEDWRSGQSASLRRGVVALGERVEAVVVTLGDQPAISALAIDRIVAARDRSSVAVRANYGGRPGHPVLLERPLLARLGVLRGDAGARALFHDAAVRNVACDGLGDDLDIDTPDQLQIIANGSGSRP